jgi:signal transduction histidine kinase
MPETAESPIQTKQTTLEKTITAALNEVGAEAALVAIFDRDSGPLVSHGFRGFSVREVQAVIRTLSAYDIAALGRSAPENGEARMMRLRLITPSSKALLALPLRFRQRIYGLVVVGKKDGAGFTKKERMLIESAGEDITSALERANLFDTNVVLGRSLVMHEPAAQSTPAELAGTVSYATPELEQRISALLDETGPTMPFDRAWVTYYDPLAGAVEVLAVAGELSEHKKELKAGQRLALDASASGWAVRHRKPRVDQDLASTQGRFQDHKHLFKDRFRSSLVMPFFVRGQVGGTITLASKTPMQYSLTDARLLEPLVGKLAEVLQEPMAAASTKPESGPQAIAPAPAVGPSEPLIRKEERQLAIGEFSAFLATEVREPLASIRAQLEEITAEGILDFDPQTRVENAMRDLIRVETILNEILDFAKPLELNRRICRIPDIIESALRLISTEMDVNRIHVTKQYRVPGQARCDDNKMQQVFLSIFKNALEAMTPGGHLEIEVSLQKPGRNPELQILIKNDGVPIPTEHVGKVFEPYFTTKRSGTGLGLATVKKIVEEHHGQISIASGPGQGTTVIIHLPAPIRGGLYRGRRGRGRRAPRREGRG